MISAIIIDDEENARDIIRMIIEEHSMNIRILGEAGSVLQGAEMIKLHKPDLVFLDIEMPDGTGFNLLSHFQEKDFQVIFITGHSGYAIKAIKVNALDYILKPIQPYELLDAIKKIETKILSGPNQSAGEITYASIFRNISEKPKKISIKTVESILLIDISEIIRCEADRNYTNIYLSNGKKYISSKTLGEFEDQLDGYGFVRVHKSHLINSLNLSFFDKTMGGTLVMKDKSIVPVSSRKKEELIRFLEQFK